MISRLKYVVCSIAFGPNFTKVASSVFFGVLPGTPNKPAADDLSVFLSLFSEAKLWTRELAVELGPLRAGPVSKSAKLQPNWKNVIIPHW